MTDHPQAYPPLGVDVMRHLVVSLLTARASTLGTWRTQVPTQGGRTKSFENWLLVELVALIGRERPDARVRTNGYVDAKYEPRDRRRVQPHLHGRKRGANTLSPDLSVLHDGFAVHCELKTGLSAIDLLDDVEIVRDYNTNDATRTSTACLMWAILLPEDGASALRSVERISTRANCGMTFDQVTPWLKVCVSSCRVSSGRPTRSPWT